MIKQDVEHLMGLDISPQFFLHKGDKTMKHENEIEIEDGIEINKGMVAFLDILGYANFLENNDPKQAAEIVLRCLLNSKDIAPDTCKSLFMEGKHFGLFKSLFDDIKWLIFSDTIVLLNSYGEDDTEQRRILRWKVFFLLLIALYRHLLDNGLPVRGSITYGDFFVKDYCFAGRSIISAYKLSNRLDLSAIVLDQSALDELIRVRPSSDFHDFAHMRFEYLIPMKNQPSKKMYALYPSLKVVSSSKINDLRQGIAESFWKHNKDIHPEVTPLLNNTELFFRHAKMNQPNIFEKKE